MTLNEAVHTVYSYTLVKNCYMDLDGTIRPHKFPSAGMWTFDGQFFVPPHNPFKKGEVVKL